MRIVDLGSEPDRIIYGGTFDPPHMGHLSVIQRALERFPSAQLDVVVAFSPAGAFNQHKIPQASFPQRLVMCQLAFGAYKVNSIEENLPVPNYTWRTLAALQERDPGHHWALLMGRDQFQSLPGWQNASELINDCDIIVVDRDEAEAWGSILQKMSRDFIPLSPEGGDSFRWQDRKGRVFLLQQSVSPAASRDIRRAPSQAIDSGWLSPAVADYISNHRLYSEN